MKFEVRELHVINESWRENFDDFFLQVHCEIGEVGGAGGKAILIHIVSPKGLAREVLSTDGFSAVLALIRNIFAPTPAPGARR